VLKDASERFLKDLRDTGAKLIVTPLPTITANTSLMTQLFENLIGNALKYRNGNNPVIKIKCKEEKNNFLFSVSDNGIGIAPKYWEKIFLLFQRLHNDNGSNEGTGIGLAICKKIVGLHRGAIWVESEEGKGSTFYFSIAKDQNQVYEKV
jgi:chemotaxis family two-component system sensor kinase Cph1